MPTPRSAARALSLAAIMLSEPVRAASSRMHDLKAEIQGMTADEAKARFGDIRPLGPPPPRQDKIDHMVVLFMENRAFDHILGCMDHPEIDGIPPEGRLIPTPAPPPPPAPAKSHNTSTCRSHVDMQAPGSTYSNITGKAASIAQCCELCGQDVACKAYTFTPNSVSHEAYGTCLLSNASGYAGAASDPLTVSGSCISPDPRKPYCNISACAMCTPPSLADGIGDQWIETQHIKWCSGGGDWTNFSGRYDYDALGAGMVGSCPLVPSNLSEAEGVAACEAMCETDSTCLGFTWYPAPQSRANLTACCFRTGSVASKPECPAGDASCTGTRCYEKQHPAEEQYFVNITCGNTDGSTAEADYICKEGPGFSLWDANFADDSKAAHYPYGEQNNTLYAGKHGAANGSQVHMFTPEQLPVKSAIVEHFATFNRYFTQPTASTPNHLFAQSATSCGNIGNSLYSSCGGHSEMYPQLTIYDNMRLNNVSFKFYMNNTAEPNWPGTDCTRIEDNCSDPVYLTPIDLPDIIMEGVARHKDRFFNQTEFYKDAAAGTLPSFSWIMPRADMCDHPCHDIALGERLHKDIYEALRAGKNWEKTAFFIIYDDTGGFFDHVVPPAEGVPSDESPCNIPTGSCPKAFDFKRLGTRGTAMALSPLIPKGTVVQTPKGPTPSSQYEHSSISATIVNLFNLTTGFLTKRDAWAGSFHELFTLSEPRTDCPMHLPEAPPHGPPVPPAPAPAPSTATRHRSMTMLDAADDDGEGAVVAQHCGLREQTCPGVTEVNTNQRNKITLLSRLTMKPQPDLSNMGYDDANDWIGHSYSEWLAQGAPMR